MADRRSLVRSRGVARAPGAEPLTCVDCGRVAIDVRVERDGYVRCFSGVGCQAKAELIRRHARRLARGAA